MNSMNAETSYSFLFFSFTILGLENEKAVDHQKDIVNHKKLADVHLFLGGL